MNKKSIITLTCLIFLTSFIIAQSSNSNYKLEIDTSKDIFEAGENITLKVTVRDSGNRLVNDEVSVTLEDAEKNVKVQKTVLSNRFVEINPTEMASHGTGEITASYEGVTATSAFIIGIEELAHFEIHGEYLTITNIGNTKYSKTVQITIGDTTGIKEPKLNIGESVQYRLVAPDGTYNIRISDGTTVLTLGEVQLTGTGNVVGALNERAESTSGITGISPDEKTEGGEILLSPLERGIFNNFSYVFILIVFGVAVLLAIERHFRRQLFGLGRSH